MHKKRLTNVNLLWRISESNRRPSRNLAGRSNQQNELMIQYTFDFFCSLFPFLFCKLLLRFRFFPYKLIYSRLFLWTCYRNQYGGIDGLLYRLLYRFKVEYEYVNIKGHKKKGLPM
jgi:hypothetical protein